MRQNNHEVIILNCIKKLFNDHRLLTYAAMTLFGIALGLITAKIIAEKQSCASKLKSKAKQAFKAVEDKIM